MNVLRANWPLIEAASRWAGAALALVGCLLLVWWAWRGRFWIGDFGFWIWGRLGARSGWARVRGGLGCFCPGPGRVGWWRVFVRPCGYDLSGLPGGPLGEVTCPECGRTLVPARQGLRRIYRFRAARAGVVLVLVGLMLSRGVPFLKHGQWQRSVPTTVLVLAKRALGARLPTRLYRELLGRVGRKKLSAWQGRLVVPGFLEDLRGDGRTSNAWQAMEALESLAVDGAVLEGLLGSADYQQRQLAAEMLRDRCAVNDYGRSMRSLKDGACPSEALLRVTVEGLRSDGINFGAGLGPNARDGFWFLAHFPERIDAHLERAMRGDDAQLRLLAAGAAGYAGRRGLVDLAAPILVEHLRDNRTWGDARFSVRCLYCLGYDAVPYLARAMNDEDCQLAGLARLILRDLRLPLERLPPPVAELRKRITVVVGDPAVSDLGFGPPGMWQDWR
jgi:hypothetical protein